MCNSSTKNVTPPVTPPVTPQNQLQFDYPAIITTVTL